MYLPAKMFQRDLKLLGQYESSTSRIYGGTRTQAFQKPVFVKLIEHFCPCCVTDAEIKKLCNKRFDPTTSTLRLEESDRVKAKELKFILDTLSSSNASCSRFNFDNCLLGYNGIKVFIRHPVSSQAQYLSLVACWMDKDGTPTELNLYRNSSGAEGAKSLAESSTLSNLTSLNLGYNGIGAEGAKSLAESSTLSNLTSLNLGYNGIGAEGAKSLAESSTLSNLTSLKFD